MIYHHPICNQALLIYFLMFILLFLHWVSIAVHRLLIVVASLVAEHRL